MSHFYISREDLYEKVWTTPVSRLAPELGLSDRGLSKLCARMEIPTPGCGHWRKVELGHRVKKEPLPSPSYSCHRYANFSKTGIAFRNEVKSFKDDPWVVRIKDTESKPENKIIVPETIHRLHPLVSKSLKSLRSGYVDKYGRSRPSETETLDICCSKKAAPRVGRIFHVLMASLKDRGHALTVKRKYYPYSPGSSYVATYIEYFGEDIRISLMERAQKVPHTPTAREAKYNYGPNHDFIPNGQLILKVENAHWYRGKQSWLDTEEKPLEVQLNRLMVDLAKISLHLKKRREEEERERLEEERRKQAAEEARLRQLEEQHRIEYLEGLIAQWSKAQKIREFLLLAEATPIDLAPEGMDKEDWLRWVRGYSDSLDPLLLIGSTPLRNQQSSDDDVSLH